MITIFFPKHRKWPLYRRLKWIHSRFGLRAHWISSDLAFHISFNPSYQKPQ